MLPLGESKMMQVNYQVLLISSLVSLLDLNFNIYHISSFIPTNFHPQKSPVGHPPSTQHPPTHLGLGKFQALLLKTQGCVPLRWWQCRWQICRTQQFLLLCQGGFQFLVEKNEMILRYCWWFRTPAHHLGCTKPRKFWDPSDSNSNPCISVQYIPQQIP